MLLERGADVQLGAPFSLVAEIGSLDIIKVLPLKAGADINIEDVQGGTALMLASKLCNYKDDEIFIEQRSKRLKSRMGTVILKQHLEQFFDLME